MHNAKDDLDEKLSGIIGDIANKANSSGLKGLAFTWGTEYQELIRQIFKDAGWITPDQVKKTQELVNQMVNLANDMARLPAIQYAEPLKLSKDKSWELCVICSKPVSDGRIHDGDLLNGQYWYDKFIADIRSQVAQDNSRQFSLFAIGEAAKKAAGIKQ